VAVAAAALALLSSLVWGTADLGGGLLARRHALLAVLFVEQLPALLVALALLGLDPSGRPGAAGVAWGLLGGVVGAAALAAFYRGLSIGTMSIVAPVSAVGAVVPVAVGVAGGERPAVLQLVGIVVALAGITLAAREPGGRAPAGAARAALGYAGVAALGFGLFFVAVDGASSRGGVPWVLVTVRISEIAVLGTAFLAVRPPVPRSPRALAPLAAVGLLDVAANATYALATTRGLLSLVSVLGSLYPAVTVLLARLLLGERVSRTQEAGVAACLAGVLAITAG
jgi:drug/metabolite transporter (DMT)-like permease